MSSLKVSSLAGRVSGDAPTLTDGAVLPVGVALTGGGGINVTGIITGSSYRGDGSQLTGIDPSALKSGGSVKVQATATGAEVTGNLSVGGTLTYQDVQNVDSVGIVTARSGIVVVSGGASITAGGLNVTGVVTATSFSGSGANLSDAAPTISLVADGAIAANTSVIVTSGGKAKTISGFADAMGDEIQIAGTTATNFAFSSVAEDASTGRVVYLYRNNAVSPNATYYVVGTRSGTSVTWGTAASLCDTDTDGNRTQIVAIGTDKFFAIYEDKFAGTDNYYTRVISTTSSNTATLGTKIVMTDSSNNNLTDIRLPQLEYNSDNGAIIGVYNQNGGASGGTVARMWTVSGTTITRGAPHQVKNENPETLSTCLMKYKNSVAIVFRWNNNQFNSAIIKIPDSGTTLSSLVINVVSETGGNHQIAFDDTNQVLIGVYQRSDSSDWIYYSGVWESNGSTGGIDWYSGSQRVLNAGGALTSYDYGKLVYQPDAKKFLLVLQDSDNDGWRMSFVAGGSTGTKDQTMVADPNSKTEFDTSFYQRNYVMKVAGSGAVLVPYGHGDDQKLRIRQYTSTTLTSGNFVGFSDGTSYSDGQTVKIKVVGNTSTQSSLTPGSLYYVQTDGTLGTTAATPSVVAGKAISSTKLLIQPA